MNSVTNSYIWLKYYLSFYLFAKANIKNFKIVANGMRGYNSLAIALNDFYSVSKKNINETVYSFFMLIIMSLSSADTSQFILSPLESSKIPAISEGIVVLKDFERGFCCITFDFTSNNFIHSFLSFVINIFVNILYIFYPQYYNY